ncbi:MAG: protein translocase subunit SecF [Eubacteriales bacterium]
MIVEKFKITIWISICILALGLIFGFIFGGLNLGLDFTGGSIININMGKTFVAGDVTKALEDVGINQSTVIQTGTNLSSAQIRLQESNVSAQAEADLSSKILAGIQKTYPDASITSQDKIAAVASQTLVINAFLAVLISCVLMMIYIWIRFELYPGLSAVIALLHDVAIMTAFMCIFRVPVNSSFIAACLTIVGYSIMDTVVLYDRVRDNTKLLGLKKFTRNKIANISIWETLGRTINTSSTTTIMVVLLYILGVESIREFAFPLIVGIVAGKYSSIFIAVPISIKLQDRYLGEGQLARTHKKQNSQKTKTAK